jgi:hypothetical protein
VPAPRHLERPEKNWSIVKIEVSAGVKIYEGVAAPQGGLVGGGNQVFVPKVDAKWIVK